MHALPRLLAQLAGAVERLGDRARRDPGESGHVADGGRRLSLPHGAGPPDLGRLAAATVRSGETDDYHSLDRARPERLASGRKPISALSAPARRDRDKRTPGRHDALYPQVGRPRPLLAAWPMLATACGGGGGGDTGGDAGGGAARTGTITIWARDSQQGFMSQLVDLYNKSHQVQAKVTIIPAASFVQKLGTAAVLRAAARTSPPSTSSTRPTSPRRRARGHHRAGRRAALQGRAEPVAPRAVHLRGPDLRAALHRGGLGGLLQQGPVREGRARPREAADHATPRSVTAAKKIRALGDDYYGFTFAGACGGCNVFELTPHVWASGGDVLSEDGKQAPLDSPQVTDALQLYRDMWTDGSIPSAAKNDARHAADPALHQRQARHDPARAPSPSPRSRRRRSTSG